MASVNVRQVQCDRCKRTELLPPLPPGQPEKKEPDFEATLHTVDEQGKPLTRNLKFEDLCPRCKTALSNYWSALEEWDRDGKPLIGLAQADEKAAPVQPPPSFTPPKPHSPSAAKK